MALARTKPGTLKLAEDSTGLHLAAGLDPRNPTSVGIRSAVERGDLDGFSFQFRDLAPTWNADFDRRQLTNLDLNGGDTSIVNFGASPATAGTASLRAQLSTSEVNNLPDAVFGYIEPGGTKDSTGRTVPRRLRRYPLPDAEHVRNALARIAGGAAFGKEAMPKVKAAAKKFGVTIAESKALLPNYDTEARARIAILRAGGTASLSSRSPLHGKLATTHSHSHPANGSKGSWRTHTHTHTHGANGTGDANHVHVHDTGAINADVASSSGTDAMPGANALHDADLEARLTILRLRGVDHHRSPRLTFAEQVALDSIRGEGIAERARARLAAATGRPTPRPRPTTQRRTDR
jgi:hypothetical protein